MTNVSVNQSGSFTNIHIDGEMVLSIDKSRDEMCIYSPWKESEEPVTVIRNE